MTAGAGSYHLAGTQHWSKRDDFIYMAPYCPQSFVATGDEPAEYLLYRTSTATGLRRAAPSTPASTRTPASSCSARCTRRGGG